MVDEPTPPLSPWQLTPARIVLLALGLVVVLIVVSSLLGGLDNYQSLREAAQAGKSEAVAPAVTDQR